MPPRVTPKSLACLWCGKGFTSLRGLKVHHGRCTALKNALEIGELRGSQRSQQSRGQQQPARTNRQQRHMHTNRDLDEESGSDEESDEDDTEDAPPVFGDNTLLKVPKTSAPVFAPSVGNAYSRLGEYLTRCVVTFISIPESVRYTRDHIVPTRSAGATARSVGTPTVQEVWGEAMLQYDSKISDLLKNGDVDVINAFIRHIAKGYQRGRASDARRLKTAILELVDEKRGTTQLELKLSSTEIKSDRGFNHDVLGRMLVPIALFADYEADPAGMRAAINASSAVIAITGDEMPAFMYENPSAYNPDDVLFGFMRGYFLLRCFRSIFLGPSAAVPKKKGENDQAMDGSDQSVRGGMLKKYGINSVTLPMVIYSAMQARFCLSSSGSWKTQEKLFSYKEFAHNMIEICTLDQTWAQETVAWWNQKIFGHPDGRIGGRPKRTGGTSGTLAKAKMQVARRLAEKEAAAREAAAAEAAAARESEEQSGKLWQ
ncbi:hypothetical protein BC834DRAFT_604979 [Gloeopeniophorella convolvens]|nr:hypothetical protein BC834DRAFT_604979 [Gloeopeniophorella convolvens]